MREKLKKYFEHIDRHNEKPRKKKQSRIKVKQLAMIRTCNYHNPISHPHYQTGKKIKY